MLKLLPLPLFTVISNLVWTVAVNISLCYLFLGMMLKLKLQYFGHLK